MSTERTERSSSRGRVLQMSGRGGAGNYRSPSCDRATNGPEDYSDTRGREPVPSGDPEAVISTGRGGRGNIRSPSREPGLGDTASLGVSPARSLSRGRAYERSYDQETIASIDIANDTGVHSTGRGGVGNMTHSPLRPDSDSKSRSRSREPAAHTTGRGGTGNMVHGGPTEKVIEEQDESERSIHSHVPGMHSAGRGGVGNLTAGEVPYSKGGVNPHSANHPHATHSHLVETVGRGGLGNSLHA